MIADRKIVEKEINKIVKPLIFKNQAIPDVAKLIMEKHNIPDNLIIDYLTNNKSLGEASVFELYCICEALMDTEKVKKYFSPVELAGYKKEVLKNASIDFPICIKCVQVDIDQFIGTMDARLLYDLRANQLINYNKQTQRSQQRIIEKGETSYKIMLNMNAVNSIKDSFKSRNFIPNTLTLNIPPESDSEFEYDPKTCELIINKLQYFDIIDGYHRYVAVSDLMDSDPTFNYPLEVRITSFDVPRAQTFIYQEDQKTKMRKIDSNSMNANNVANIITERVNKDPSFVLYDQIQRNGGNIDFAEFADILNYLISSDRSLASMPVTQKVNREKTMLVRRFNELSYDSPFDFISHKYDFAELCIILYGIYQQKENKSIFEALGKKDQLTPKKFSIKHARKILFLEIDRLW